MNDSPRSSNTGALILAWAFVGVPLLWGVILTCINAAKLFQ
ncbi:MAG: oxalate:formate antiporter [Vulcanimicrobiaceae bacterium]|jgi:hypothetical protein